MLITIIYNTDFGEQAASLKGDVQLEWADCSVNKIGVKDSLVGAKYQVQLNGNIVYTGQEPTDNTTIINSIKERL
jgi:hypothetical protein|tara:strand:+ start:189 stop:413 length:225 start_codon:yes stop_codon:yes gene_type:complete